MVYTHEVIGSSPIWNTKYGEMSEGFKEPVLKTGDGRKSTVGSNPTLAATYRRTP